MHWNIFLKTVLRNEKSLNIKKQATEVMAIRIEGTGVKHGKTVEELRAMIGYMKGVEDPNQLRIQKHRASEYEKEEEEEEKLNIDRFSTKI